jgi:hypothetical protein
VGSDIPKAKDRHKSFVSNNPPPFFLPRLCGHGEYLFLGPGAVITETVDREKQAHRWVERRNGSGGE